MFRFFIILSLNLQLSSYRTFSQIPAASLHYLQIAPYHLLHWSAIEAMQRDDLSIHYHILENENKQAYALFYVQAVQVGSQHIKNISHSRVINFLFNLFLKALNFRLVVMGNIMAEMGSGVFLSKQFNPIDNEIIVNYINKIMQLHGANMALIKDFDNFDITDFGYQKRPNDISMNIKLNERWSDFEIYEKDLTHKYAQRVRKIRKGAMLMQTRTLNYEEIEAQKYEIVSLYHQVIAQQSIKLAIVNTTYFVELKRSLGDGFEIIGWYYNEALVGMQSYFINENSIETHYIGIDYHAPKELNIYFNILYYSLEKGIKEKKKMLQFGRTALDAKAQMGGEPYYHQTYYLINNTILRKIVHYVANRFSNGLGESWQSRRPLKNKT